MISWESCYSICEKYFPDKIAVLSAFNHCNDDIVSNCHNLYNKLLKKHLTLGEFVVKNQERKASDASDSNSKRPAICERDKDHDEDGDNVQQQPTPQ